jgi:hypothetical protein
MSPEETLAWEAEHRQRAGIASIVAALLTFLGVVVTTVGQPSASKYDDRIVTVIDAMGKTAAGQPVPPGRISAYAVDVGQHPVLPIVGAIFYGVGSMAIFFVLAYLFRATRARRPEMPQFALVLAAVGAVGFGLGRAIAEVARYVGAHGFVNAADKSNSAATDALQPTAALVGQVIWEFCALTLGVALIIIALNAMRVGLLTRFMGVLGIIVGVTVAPVLPLDQQGIIRIFWLGALGFLVLGRWPNIPRAWSTGQAEPWPSQQQLREQRDAARARQRGEPEPAETAETAEAKGPSPERRPPAAPAPTPPRPRRPDPSGDAHSASKKKKRKRRS